MTAALKLSVLGWMTFFIALIVRWAFFGDIKPLAADQSSPTAGALEAAFLLLSIQNVAAAVGIVALLVAVTLQICRWKWVHRCFGKTLY